MKPESKAPETMLLKLGSDQPLSNFAFEFNLRRYNKWVEMQLAGTMDIECPRWLDWFHGRGLHPSTSHLNLSRF